MFDQGGGFLFVSIFFLILLVMLEENDPCQKGLCFCDRGALASPRWCQTACGGDSRDRVRGGHPHVLSYLTRLTSE